MPHEIFKWQVEVPKTIMSGETANIGQFLSLAGRNGVSFALPLSPSINILSWLGYDDDLSVAAKS